MDGENLTDLEKAKQALEKVDISAVMSTENGRRFVWRILEFCGIYRDIEGEGSEMLKQIGNRQTGLYILAIVSDNNEEEVFKMMKEAKNRATTEEEFYDSRNRSDTNSGTNTNPSSGSDSGSYSGGGTYY